MGVTINYLTDMDDVFLESGFQEDISYTASGAAAVNISAIVFRDGTREFTDGSVRGIRGNNYRVVVMVSKTDVPKVTRGEDTVVASWNNATETYRVNGILEEDAGAFYLGCT